MDVCDCCRSYWQFSVPEPDPKAIVADHSTGFCPGARTVDEEGNRGPFQSEWFDRPGDCVAYAFCGLGQPNPYEFCGRAFVYPYIFCGYWTIRPVHFLWL